MSTSKKDQAPFYHGVASGDPLADRVIIWTRITPENEGEHVVNWYLSEDINFGGQPKSGTASAIANNDYTVKVDVTGLKANTRYYFKFSYGGKESVVGQTKTTPTQSEQIKLAIVSCSNFEAGFYNAFAHMANDPRD